MKQAIGGQISPFYFSKNFFPIDFDTLTLEKINGQPTTQLRVTRFEFLIFMLSIAYNTAAKKETFEGTISRSRPNPRPSSARHFSPPFYWAIIFMRILLFPLSSQSWLLYGFLLHKETYNLFSFVSCSHHPRLSRNVCLFVVRTD